MHAIPTMLNPLIHDLMSEATGEDVQDIADWAKQHHKAEQEAIARLISQHTPRKLNRAQRRALKRQRSKF